MYRFPSNCLCPCGLLLRSCRGRDSERGWQKHSPGKSCVGCRKPGLLRVERQAGASWGRGQVCSCLILDSGKKHQCSIVILSRLCLLKEAIGCGSFFENGLKSHLYLVMQMLVGKENFIFNFNSLNILSVHRVPGRVENGFGREW